MKRLNAWLGAYAPCWPSMFASWICSLIDQKFIAGICLGIAIHQWIVAYTTYGLTGKANDDDAY